MTDSNDRDFIGEGIAEDDAKRMQPLVTLAEAMRKFRKIDGDEDAVTGYDYDLTRKAFNELRQQLADASNERGADAEKVNNRQMGLVQFVEKHPVEQMGNCPLCTHDRIVCTCQVKP